MNWKKVLQIIIYIFALIGFIFVIAFIAIKLHLTNTVGIVDEKSRYLTLSNLSWTETPEWQTLKAAIIKDAPVINKAAQDADVDPRLITAQLVVEQLRLYASNREIFKQVFEPLQILGVQSQYSWGVMGLKQDTLIQIENNLKNPTSEFYLGQKYEHTLDFSTSSEHTDTERFNRVTDEHNHYYSYLYAALYLKEVMSQWQKAGFDISNNPGVLSTLYNIGFEHSKPNAHPEIGGASIEINGTTYSFGGLAASFYYSSELKTELK